MKKHIKLIMPLLAVFVLILPLVLSDPYYKHMVNVAFLYAISIYGFNIISGLTGQYNFAHAGFVGIGAYSSAILSSTLGFPVIVSMIASVCITAIFGLAIGFPALRTRGVYFALTTLGFGMILYIVFENLIEVTGGPMGFTGIASLKIVAIGVDFSSKTAFYYLSLLFLAVAIYINHELFRSRLGRSMLAVRENEDLALSVGISVVRTKIIAFVLATILLGLSGSLYAHYFRFISPVSFTIEETFRCLTMLVVGGVGTLAGPLVGSVIFTILPEVLREFAQFQWILYGLILMLCIAFMPEGIVGFINKRAGKSKQ